MRDHLPTGLRGMLVASFLAAYMSTISTQLNWGTSYVMHDFYRRFINPQAGEKALVNLSRVMTVVLMVLSLGVTSILDTISGAWAFIIEAGAGLGLVLILRWYWWRINAWSEIAAMVTPLLVYGYLRAFTTVAFPETLYVIVGITTVAWLAVTFLTPPPTRPRSSAFFRRVHPGGPGWAPVARRVSDVRPDTGLGRLLVDTIAGVVLVYCTLFASGQLLFGSATAGLVYLAVAVAAGVVIFRDLSRRGFGTLVD